MPAFSLFDPFPRLMPWAPFPESGFSTFSDSIDRQYEHIPAQHLHARLLALRNALDTLPAQADRLIRWFKRRHRDNCRPRRLWPLKPGFAPGWREMCETRERHDVDDILDGTAILANTLRQEFDEVKIDTS